MTTGVTPVTRNYTSSTVRSPKSSSMQEPESTVSRSFTAINPALISRKGGSQQEALELRPGEFITGLWANDYGDCGSIFALKLQVTKEDGHIVKTAQYGQADAWKYSFDGHEGSIQGGGTKRLLWLSGWDYDDWRSGWIMRLLPAFGHYEVWGPLK